MSQAGGGGTSEPAGEPRRTTATSGHVATASGRQALASPRLGLRERKKIKTRLAIQQHALRLFQEQGYEGTTVEQIAEAAEISPSTFFRYFPTKDAVVLTDDYDPLLIDVLRAQPASVGVIRAIRTAYRAVFAELTEREQENFFERAQFIMQVPELRASFLDSLTAGVDLIIDIIAERSHRSPDDLEVRAAAGALMGLAVTEFLYWSRHPETDFTGNIDRAMETLEAAFPW